MFVTNFKPEGKPAEAWSWPPTSLCRVAEG